MNQKKNNKNVIKDKKKLQNRNRKNGMKVFKTYEKLMKNANITNRTLYSFQSLFQIPAVHSHNPITFYKLFN